MQNSPTNVSVSRRRKPQHSKLRSWYRRWVGSIIFWLAVATGVSGFVGFTWQYIAAKQSAQEQASDSSPKPITSSEGAGTVTDTVSYDPTVPIFRTVQLFLLDSGAEDDEGNPDNIFLAVARMCAVFLFLVVSKEAIGRVVDAVRRLPQQLTEEGHVVICGLGQIGLRILDDLCDAETSPSIVIVENNPNNPWLEYARSRKAFIIIGDATRAEILEDARAIHAREVFVVSGDDGVNLEVAAELGQLLQEQSTRKSKLEVYVHIVDVSLATSLRPYCGRLHDTRLMDIHVFNVPKTAATRLVVNQLWPFAPKKKEEVAHYVILGFGPMAQILAVQLAQLAHFPNRKRCRMTIADRDVSKSAREFQHLFPRFTSWTDAQLGVTEFSDHADAWEGNQQPLPADIQVQGEQAIQYVCNAQFLDLPAARSDERFAKKIAAQFAKPQVKPVIFVCGHNDHDNFETAVELREHLTQLGCSDVPTFVWLPRQPALAEALIRDGDLMPFGKCVASASYDEIVNPSREVLGEIIHDDYQRQGIEDGWTKAAEPWDETADGFRESSRAAADHMHIKLALGNRKLVRTKDASGPAAPMVSDGPKANTANKILAQMEHNRWVAERLMSGWRYAQPASKEEEKANKKKRLNKNITPWDQLGPEAQKDFDQVEVVLRKCQELNDFQVRYLATHEEIDTGKD